MHIQYHASFGHWRAFVLKYLVDFEIQILIFQIFKRIVFNSNLYEDVQSCLQVIWMSIKMIK